ncbi:MAG TPA: anti-sigma factor [Thermoanaerobaculia bacterium]|nr:anti-sigma factor [Thermoanaerobaculia bacterium]
MTDDTREDQTIEETLAALTGEHVGAPGAVGARPQATAAADTPLDPETETLKRLYDEVFGLLPFALEPQAPPAELRRRLLSTVLASLEADLPEEPAMAERAAAMAKGAADPPSRQSVIFGKPGPSPTAPSLHPPAATGSEAGGLRPPAGRPAATGAMARRGVRWPLVIAAALVLALVGLSGWLVQTLAEQNQTIARLGQERDEARQRFEETSSRTRQLLQALGEMQGKLALVTSPAVEISSLRPVGAAPPEARGVLFVAADHQHWYMTLSGLRPAGSGRCYELWFLGDQGPVSGGLFDARSGSPAELGSKSMPQGIKSVSVTVEPAAGSARPSGPEVLRAAAVFQVL